MTLTRPLLPALLCLLATLGAAGSALAQSGDIFTCVDRNGKRHTSDRPIPSCLDREQEIRSRTTGTVRKVIPPSYTAEEKAAIEAQQRAQEEERARVAEEKRRERALLIRYPNQTSHDRARAEALSSVDEALSAAQRREGELMNQRREIDNELEFYQADPSRAPAWLKRKQEDNQAQFEAQRRFVDGQLREKQRINARFDDELARLRQLWGPAAAGAVSPASGAAGR